MVNISRYSLKRQLQETALLALAALSKDNPAVATVLARADRDSRWNFLRVLHQNTHPLPLDPPILSTIVPFIKSRNVDIQLAAALW